MAVVIQPDRTTDHLAVTPGDAAWLANAFEAAARVFTKRKLEIKFQIGPRRGQLTAVQLFAAAKALKGGDSGAAHGQLTSAIGLPSRLIELDTLAYFLDDVAGATIPEGHFVFITKQELKALRLAGTDPLYGDAGAASVELESRAPATSAPQAGAARRGPVGGVAAGLKSGRISRAFNPRASDRARHASLRGHAQTYFDRMARLHPNVGDDDQTLMEQTIANPELATLFGDEDFGDTIAHVTERQLRDGLVGSLGRWRPRFSEATRARLVNRWVDLLGARLPNTLGSKGEGPALEVVNSLNALLAPMAQRNAWEALPQDVELQACLALMTMNEVRDTLYNVSWRHEPAASRADRVTRVKNLARNLEDELGAALAERMRTEAVRTYASAAEGLHEEAAHADLLLNRLNAISQAEGPLGKVLLTALGLGQPGAVVSSAVAREKLAALATPLRQESERLAQITSEALRDEVRLLAQPPDRLRRAFGAAPESALGEAFPRFFGPLDGEPPPWCKLADAVVAAGALAFGAFVDHDPSEGNPCGALAAAGTEISKLLEADVCKRLGGGTSMPNIF